MKIILQNKDGKIIIEVEILKSGTNFSLKSFIHLDNYSKHLLLSYNKESFISDFTTLHEIEKWFYEVCKNNLKKVSLYDCFCIVKKKMLDICYKHDLVFSEDILNLEYNVVKTVVKSLNSNKHIIDAANDCGLSDRSIYEYIKRYGIFKDNKNEWHYDYSQIKIADKP